MSAPYILVLTWQLVSLRHHVPSVEVVCDSSSFNCTPYLPGRTYGIKGHAQDNNTCCLKPAAAAAAACFHDEHPVSPLVCQLLIRAASSSANLRTLLRCAAKMQVAARAALCQGQSPPTSKLLNVSISELVFLCLEPLSASSLKSAQGQQSGGSRSQPCTRTPCAAQAVDGM